MSAICAPVPSTAFTYWFVSVAMPESRCNRFSATRSRGDQHVGKANHARDHFAGFDLFAIRNKRFELLLRVERQKNFFRGFETRDDHVFAGNKTSASTRVARDDRLRGDVAASEVFAQEETDLRVERAFVDPVHCRFSTVC